MKLQVYLLSVVMTMTTGFGLAQNQLPYCGPVNQGLKLESITRIGFGSCLRENKEQPILAKAAEMELDVFVWLGDNVYGDTYKMDVLKKKYAKLGCMDEFRKLNEQTYYLATWDDHDYGKDDVGKEYRMKKESKEVFLEFWSEPENSKRFAHNGIYHSIIVGEEGKRVQFILLDTRYFRDPLLKAKGRKYKHDYRPNESKDVTILGAQQWAWLEQQLLKPAEVRIICSSTQFGIEYNGYEAWANFPREREKMADLISDTKANGVVFISGDVHYAEFSKYVSDICYPLYDFTSSGITATWPHTEPNKNRIAGPFSPNNYGLLEIDWNRSPVLIIASIVDVKGKAVITQNIDLTELRLSIK